MKLSEVLIFAGLLFCSCNKKESDYLTEGISDFDHGKYLSSIKKLNKTIEFNPNEARAFLYKALDEYNLSEYSNSIRDFSRVIDLKPKDFEAYKFKGLAEYHLSQKDCACKDLRKADELGSRRAYGYIRKYCN